jgi:hypothetical protein
VRAYESCGKLQAPCGETVAARVVLVRFGAPNDAKKRGSAIPASIEALIEHAQAPRRLIAAR